MEIEKVRKKQRLEKKTLAFLASFLQWNNLVKRIFRGREWGKRHPLGWGDFEVHFNDWRKGNLFGKCVPTKALVKRFFPSPLLDIRSYEGEKDAERWKNGTSFWLNPSYFMLFYVSHHWIVWYYKNVQLIAKASRPNNSESQEWCWHASTKNWQEEPKNPNSNRMMPEDTGIMPLFTPSTDPFCYDSSG